MSTKIADIQKDFLMADKAMSSFTTALLDFKTHCLRLDWKNAEVAREKALGSIDSFLDCFAAAHKRMETE